jgi:hypothetical protein
MRGVQAYQQLEPPPKPTVTNQSLPSIPDALQVPASP